MINAEMKVVRFGENNVIATSFTLSCVLNGTLNDAKVTIDGVTYTNAEGGTGTEGVNAALENAFNAKFGAGAFTNAILGTNPYGFGYGALNNVIYYDSAKRGGYNDDAGASAAATYYNTTWSFDSATFTFTRQ